MDRADKIFLALFLAVVIGAICWRPAVKRVNTSEQAERGDSGPAYLLAALPDHRIRDDLTPSVSFPGPMTS